MKCMLTGVLLLAVALTTGCWDTVTTMSPGETIALDEMTLGDEYVIKQQHAVALAADIQRAAAEQSRRGRSGGSLSEAAMMLIEEMEPKYVDVAKLWQLRYTSAEIGERLGIPENTVKSRKTTIRKRLSEALREFSPPEK